MPTSDEPLLRGDLFAEACPSREVLRHVTSRWGVLVLVALRRGTQVIATIGAGEKMQRGDRMLVVGPPASVRRVASLA